MQSLTIWRFVDGKPGHEKQSQALLNCLSQAFCLNTVDITVNKGALHYINHYLLGKKIGPLSPSGSKPNTALKPDIVMGAGHRTHLPLLIAKRQQQAKAVVIMRPSLPQHYFDLIIAPEHDYIDKPISNQVITVPFALVDTLNSQADPNQGLILLGGPSKWFDWNTDNIAQQLETLFQTQPANIHWHISTSRRTPETCLNQLQGASESIIAENGISCEWLDYRALPQNWLEQQLKQAGHIWISADSASMIAEAMATRAKVGVLSLASRKKNNKLLKAQTALSDRGELHLLDHQTRSASACATPQHSPATHSLLDKILQRLELNP